MDKLNVIIKSEKIVSVLRTLGVEEDFELHEVTLKEFTTANYDQMDAHYGSKEEEIESCEMLEEEVIDRILKETKEVMLLIVERAYTEACYEGWRPNPKITI